MQKNVNNNNINNNKRDRKDLKKKNYSVDKLKCKTIIFFIERIVFRVLITYKNLLILKNLSDKYLNILFLLIDFSTLPHCYIIKIYILKLIHLLGFSLFLRKLILSCERVKTSFIVILFLNIIIFIYLREKNSVPNS